MSETIYSKSELRRLCVQDPAMVAEKFSRLQDHMLAISKSWQEKCDALRADNARQAEEWRKARVENCALREENERLKAQVGAEQLDADRVRTASRELEVEVERLKERLEKSEARRTHWDAVTLTNYEFTKTQLAEAVGIIQEIVDWAFVEPIGGQDLTDYKAKAREFLVKAKS